MDGQSGVIHTQTDWLIDTHTQFFKNIHATPHPDLLDVLLGPDVRRVNQGAHNLHVAMDNEGLVWPVGVDAHSPVVVDRVWQLASLPQHLVVTLKLARVGRLRHRDKEQ